MIETIVCSVIAGLLVRYIWEEVWPKRRTLWRVA